MPMTTLNLALLFVLQLAPLQFLFGNRENLLHRVSEFLRWLLLGRYRHGARYAQLFQRAITRGELNELRGVPFVFLCRFNEHFRRWRIQDFSVICNSKETIQSGRDVLTNCPALAARDNPTAVFKC